MKRRKLALVLAAAMVFTSVPVNGLTVYAEEEIVEEYGADEIIDEEPTVTVSEETVETPENVAEEAADGTDTALEEIVIEAMDEVSGLEITGQSMNGEEGSWIQVKAGDTVEMAVSASGAMGNVSYQWYSVEDGTETEIAGANEAVYTVTAEYKEDRYFRCVVSDDYGTQLFQDFYVDINTLTVENGDEIYVKPGETAVLTVNAVTSTGNTITYQWYDEIDDDERKIIEGETDATIMLDNVTGIRRLVCVVSDGVETRDVWFYAECWSGLTAKRLTSETLWALPGGSATMAVEASTEAGGEITYQWYFEDEESWEYVAISGATGPEFTVEDVREGVSYICRITDGYDSCELHFRVDIDSGFVVNPGRTVRVSPGESTEIAVYAYTDMGNLTYQWYYYTEGYEEIKIEGATGSTLLLENIQEELEYFCKVSDGYREEWVSYQIQLSEEEPVDSGLEVENADFYNTVKFPMGGSILLTANATTRLGELTYAWYSDNDYDEDGEAILLSDDSSLNVTRAGEYWCRVSNGYETRGVSYLVSAGTGLSAAGNKTSVEVGAGESAVLEVTADTDSEYGPIAYEWQKLGLTEYEDGGWSSVENGGSSALTVSSVSEPTAYRCVVSDKYDSVNVYFSVYPSGTPDSSFADAQELYTRGYSVPVLLERFGQMKYYRFTPKLSGQYQIGIAAQIDGLWWEDKVPVVYLYDAQGNILKECSVYDYEYRILYNMTAGSTYYIGAGMEGDVLGFYRIGISYQGRDENHVHAWDAGTVTKEATCTEDGVRTFTCAADGCNETKTETIPALGHDYPEEWTVQSEASCTEDGVRYKQCSRCQDMISEVIPATGHSFEGQEILEIPASATADGMRYQKCANCDELNIIEVLVRTEEQEKIDEIAEILNDTENQTAGSELVEKIKAIDNQALIDSDSMSIVSGLEQKLLEEPEEGKAAVGATRTEVPEDMDGTKVSASGAAVSVAAALQAENSGIEVDPDKTYHAQVSITNASTDEEAASYTVDISLHIVDEQNNLVDTNTELAAPIQITLPVPEMYYDAEFDLFHIVNEEQIAIAYTRNTADQTITFSTPSLSPFVFRGNPCTQGHDEPTEWTTVVAATCVLPGKETGICPRCGKPVTRVIEPLGSDGHTWDGGTVTTAPTCDTDGVKTYTCTVCGDTKPETVPATGNHTMVTVVDKAATCGAAGSQHRECSVCHTKEAATTIPATGKHTMITIVDKAATCGAAGTQHRECSVCHTKEAATAIAATGKHSFGAYVVTKAPTVLAEGTKTRTCSVCGKKESISVAKLTPTITVNATSIPLKVKQSTTKVKVSGLAAGDYVKSWTSSNTKIVKVNSAGKITAQKKTGKATVRVTLASGLYRDITVKVQKSKVATSKISGISKSLTLAKGQKATLTPVITPITTTDKVTYKSSNKKVATVSSKGVITAKAAGKAKITVTSGKKKVTVTVTVPKTKTTAINNVPGSLTLKKGKTYKLKAKRNPANSDEKLTYSSSNKKVATVDKNGKIKGKKAGTATITVKSGTVQVKCVVTVK